MDIINEEVVYSKITALEIYANDYEILKECAKLYSEHYGNWGKGHAREGNNIILSANRLKDWFPNEDTSLYTARLKEFLIGYAIAVRRTLPNHGIVSWVTQFVIHTDYRNKRIGSHLLRHIWGMSNDYAWGVITSNPYAVRALEKATRRRSDPKVISSEKKADKLLNFGQQFIGNYLHSDIEKNINELTSQINTDFNIDHSTIDERISNLKGVDWIMGNLKEKWEWFAFTFRRQKPFELGESEIKEILFNTEEYVKQAYRRMLGGIGSSDEGKPYTKYTNYEVNYIINEFKLNNNSLVYDFGCGNGRHSIALANKACQVEAIDYVKENIDMCNKNSQSENKRLVLKCEDCRVYKFKKKADLILCLYDVIGSFVDENENLNILKNIYSNLKHGGYALISVMNKDIIFDEVKKFSFSNNPNAIFDLDSSTNMEKTGEVFNPNFILYEESTEVFYRKEQFLQGKELPIELLVCDKRYTAASIISLCEQAGFEINYYRYVHAGDWETNLDYKDKHAKEILLKCKKS